MADLLQEFDEHVRGFAQSELSDRDLIANFAMGLSGEAGEVTDLLKKHLYHGKKNIHHGGEIDQVNLIKECGDVVWYWFALMQRLDCDRVAIVKSLIPFESKVQSLLIDSALRLNANAGCIADQVADYLANETDIDAGWFKGTMKEVMRYLLFIIAYFDIPLEVVFETNIEKLRARHNGTTFNRET